MIIPENWTAATIYPNEAEERAGLKPVECEIKQEFGFVYLRRKNENGNYCERKSFSADRLMPEFFDKVKLHN